MQRDYMQTTEEAKLLRELVVDVLNDMKASDITVLEVDELTSICDVMVIATGNSARHVKSIADAIIQRAKKANCYPIGVEGENQADWILTDLGDIVVHIMKPEVRAFYQLERLWSIPASTE